MIMKLDPREYLYVGNHLSRFSKREEYQRSAVNRYYYASFIYARDYFKDKTQKNLPQNIHINFLLNTSKVLKI